MSVDISSDFDSLIETFENMGDELEKVQQKTTLKAGKVVAEKLKQNVKRSDIAKESYTHMEDSIKISPLKEDEELNKTRSIHFGKLQYKAKWREYGTSTQDPDFLLSNTVRETSSEVKEITDTDIKNALGL